MKKRGFVLILFVIFLVAVSGCAGMERVQHKYLMRGQILDLSGDMAYLCIGSADGAKVGQQLSVYRFTPRTILGQGRPVGGYDRDLVGEIKIAEIVVVHMAKAKVVKGNVAVNDIVELHE